MKKNLAVIIFVLVLIFAALPANAANMEIKVDGVEVVSDVSPEIRNNRVMVPLRVLSEDLGARVAWSADGVIISKSDWQVMLKLGSDEAWINGKKVLLDAKPYLKNNRFMVPLRFLAETFGCKVSYQNRIVTVDMEPLFINDVKVGVLQQEIRMTMGGIVQEINGNAYRQAIYEIIIKNKGSQVETPVSYSWNANIDTLGSYYKNVQFVFLDMKGNTIKRFDIYSLVNAFPDELLAPYPEVLLQDVTANEWYLFNDNAIQSIIHLIDTAAKNGFVKLISNTVV